MTSKILMPLMLLGILAMPGKALAHAVQTNYFLNSQQNQLETETVFANGEPLKGAKVTVFSPSNPTTPWLQGVTDAQGRFTFAPDESIEGNWQVDIQQQGHEDFLEVPVGESGIEGDLISLKSSGDVHYAASPLILAAGIVLGIVALKIRPLNQSSR